MRNRTSTLIAAMLALAVGPTAEAAPQDQAEVVVVSNPFSRWDGTRWFLRTTAGLPFPAVLYAEDNFEVWFTGYDLRMVLSCELGENVNRHVKDADCLIEDAALEVVPWRARNPNGEEVLDETAGRLPGLKVRLQVGDDGRVAQVTLVDEPKRSRRLSIAYENIRQLISRALLGFHLRTPDQFAVGEEWSEKNSRIFSIPSWRYMPVGWGLNSILDGASFSAVDPYKGGGSDALFAAGVAEGGGGTASGVRQFAPGLPANAPDEVGSPDVSRQFRHPFDVLQAPATYGQSLIVHRLDRYKGRYVAQSAGEGALDLGDERSMMFRGSLNAVSVFEPNGGYMTERVWSLRLDQLPSSVLAEGVPGLPYWTTGELRQLGDGEAAALGPTRLVPPAQPDRGHVVP